MTYYGRWTYKFEMAAQLGAVAALIVHETKPAAYPYAVVVNSWSRENFAIATGGHNPGFPLVPGWLQLDRARQLFAATGHDFDTLKKAALSKDFRPISLGATIDFRVHNTWREVVSHNVLAKIEGVDTKLRNEHVIYTAHWDHFGRDEKLPGSRHEQIFHGALDNASGVATLLELARGYARLPTPPKRSLLFMATTGEEQGLLGAAYYAKTPLYPLSHTLANINMDGVNPWGRTRDVEIIGYGNSTLDDMVTSIAARQGRVARPESRPELGMFYRSDHFEFAKEGVPAMYVKSRTQYVDKPADYAKQKVDEYIAHDYHKVTDTVRDDWDLAGAIEDEQLLFLLGYGVAQSDTFPQWRPGTEFKARRDATLGGSR
jgi:Zn-dependent M28 family amino/carboxypeptidase